MKILNKFGLKEMFDFEEGGIPILQKGLRVCLEVMKADAVTFSNKYPGLHKFVTEYFAVKLAKTKARFISQDMITALGDKTVGIIKDFPTISFINPYFLSLDVDQLNLLKTDAERFDRDFPGSQVKKTLLQFFTQSAKVLKQNSTTRKALYQALQDSSDKKALSLITTALDKYSLCADNGEIIFS